MLRLNSFFAQMKLCPLCHGVLRSQSVCSTCKGAFHSDFEACFCSCSCAVCAGKGVIILPKDVCTSCRGGGTVKARFECYRDTSCTCTRRFSSIRKKTPFEIKIEPGEQACTKNCYKLQAKLKTQEMTRDNEMTTYLA